MSQPLPPAIHNTQFPSDLIRNLVATEYELNGPLTCEFIRRGFNDHYLITSPDAKYVFRVYFQGKYYIAGADDFRFELELLAYVRSHGVPVASAMPTKSGELLGHLVGPEGTRYTALFRFAEGEEHAALTPEQGHRLGQTMARFHTSSDTYPASYSRYHLDLAYLVERPMALIRNLFQHYGREAELEPFLPALAAWQTQIMRIPRITPAYGIIHGDPHSGNYRLAEDGQITLIDFDHGGYGWRAYDVAVCKGDLTDETGPAFLQGYQEVRTLTQEEMEAIPAFLKVRPIWDQGDILAMYPVWGKPLPGSEFCDRIVTLLLKLTA
jgi:Ser/Thr protein kinase RdoA (MazF antagonist)